MAAACAQSDVPRDRFYRLAIATPEASADAGPAAGILRVQRLNASGLVAGRPIVYHREDPPHELLTYHYHYWSKPPAILVRDVLVDCLRRARTTETVAADDLRIDADHSVAGLLHRLEHRVGTQPGVLVEIELSMRVGARGRPNHLGTFRSEVAVADNSLPAAIEGFNAAFEDICGQLAAAVRTRIAEGG